MITINIKLRVLSLELHLLKRLDYVAFESYIYVPMLMLL